MLKLCYGKAGTGKTSAIIEEIRSAVSQRQGGRIYIVPEQYSHEAEKELARACGPTASLYAEVLSFTGLARRLESELGGGACKYLDEGGRLLSMALTLDHIAKREEPLLAFKNAAGKPESQELLARTVGELKSNGITAEALRKAAGDESGEGSIVLRNKLQDLARILEEYDVVTESSGVESRDRLLVTADRIRQAPQLSFTHVYVDGFSDFTYGEKRILEELLKKHCCVTVCLTTDSLNSSTESFAIAAGTGRELERILENRKDDCKEIFFAEEPTAQKEGKDEALALFAENMFSWCDEPIGTTEAIRLYSCGGIGAECELAAAEALRLVREKNCRWRDIAIAVRGFGDYKTLLRTTFEYYGVPLYMADDSDIISRPLPALIACVYEIARSGWDCDDVISLMNTGLTGLSVSECDELADYIFTWQLDERAWHRCDSWKQNPDGYRPQLTDEQATRLERVKASAARLSGPVRNFIDHDRPERSCRQHARNLSRLMYELRVPEKMAALAAASGSEKAEELRLLWKVVTEALEQCEAVLGDTEMTMQDYGRLFLAMLSRYRITTIPTTLDRVSAGDFDRMRRRNIRHLIVLGASDTRIPQAAEENGVFTADEKEQLRLHDINLDAGDNELWREFTMIYNCLSLPSETLTMSCSITDSDGNRTRTAFVMKQAEKLFNLKITPFNVADARLTAPNPARALALEADLALTPQTAAAQRHFEQTDPGTLALQREAARRLRGSLSSDSVRKLYGRSMKISASRTDSFFDCRFGYFCRYGMRADPYEPAGFNPPEIGTFMHSIFECTAREVRELGGFKAVENEKISEIADRYIDEYVKNELGDLTEKSGRFIHLFNRLRADVHRILAEAAEELRNSEFEPIDFELNFDSDAMPRYELSGESGSMQLTGIADRVDAWKHDGRLYLRIVDYKTGSKDFSFSDIYYGHSMQMILYLMALEANGAARYGMPVAGAGVSYFPARDKIVSVGSDDEEKAEKKKKEGKKRRGMMLDEPELMDAWDTGEEKRFLPLSRNQQHKYKELISREQYDLLTDHVKNRLLEMSGCLAEGSIEANPYYVSSQKNACQYCDYAGVCGFADGEGGESVRPRKSLTSEKVWELLAEKDAASEPDSESEGKEDNGNE